MNINGHGHHDNNDSMMMIKNNDNNKNGQKKLTLLKQVFIIVFFQRLRYKFILAPNKNFVFFCTIKILITGYPVIIFE